jgi:cell division transport system permease protein
MILLKRIFLAGILGFYRNRTVSLSSILILTITLSIIVGLFVFRGVIDFSINEIKSKVDISIYMKKDATEDEIDFVYKNLQNLDQVNTVTLVTKEQVYENFKEKYKDNPETLEALEQVGNNPFGATINVKAKETADYEVIIAKINDEDLFGVADSSIDKVNYFDIKDSIDKLTKITAWLDRVGTIIVAIFALMSFLIVYNTMRLAIFTFRDEISVMKLVGASNMYIRGPFLVEAAIYGIISTIITLAVAYPITAEVSKRTIVLFDGFNIATYFQSNFFQITTILLFSGVAIAFFSSLFAVRKYLKV